MHRLGLVLDAFLSSRSALRCAAVVALLAGGWLVALPARLALIAITTSGLFWRKYTVWSPIVHAPLPLKLLIGRQLYVWAQQYFQLLEKFIASQVLEFESRVLERAAPIAA